jgi:EmrB/QacA subfamily drug resistance transporter
VHAPPGSWSRPTSLVVAAAFFLETFDGTVLVTATPAIARDFDVRSADVGIAITVYLLAVAVFIPVSGWAADRWGARRVFCSAIVVFVVASLVCAASSSLGILTVARALQGIGGSMMVPVGRLIVLRGSHKSQLLRVIAYLTWPALVAPVVAPLAGGAIVEFAGWPWIFLVNAPLGSVLFVLSLRIIPRDQPGIPRRLDVPGLVGVSITLTCGLIGLDRISVPQSAVLSASLLGVAGLAGAVTVRHLRARFDPLIDLSELRTPTFRVTNSSGLLYRSAVSSVPFLVPLLLQEKFGWSPVAAGAMVMWVFAGNLAVKPATSWLIRRLGFARVIIGSAIGVALTLGATAVMTTDTPVALMAIVFFVSGVVRSTGFTAYGTIQFADIDSRRMSGANTLSSIVVQLATALGIAIAAVAVRLVEVEWACVVMAAVAALSAIGAVRLPPGAAEVVRAR